MDTVPQHAAPIALDPAARSALGGRPRRLIQSVARALDILETFSRGRGEMKLNEIAAATGLNISTCHHLLTTLVERGYVGQDPRQRTYYLGSRVIELSSARVRQLDLVQVAMPELHRLNAATGETVQLAVMLGHDLVVLAKTDSPHAVRVDSGSVGTSNAAHATAIGKAILAWLPEPEIARIVARKGLPRFTAGTITALPDLIEHLRLVRRHGFALDNEEFQPGVISIGCAIRDHAGAVIGALSCSLPAMRAEQQHLDFVTGRVRDSARLLSETFGNVHQAVVEQDGTQDPVAE